MRTFKNRVSCARCESGESGAWRQGLLLHKTLRYVNIINKNSHL